MRYIGSKNRIAKHITPIMIAEADRLGVTTWVEPFVGGANMIDKIPNRFMRIGCDANAHTIAALTAIRDMVQLLPDVLTEEDYRSLRDTPADPLSSWLRFVASFGGKFENGYARGVDRNYVAESRRNALRQSPLLQGVSLRNARYEDCSSFKNCLIYCDPPYEGTTGYVTGSFDSEKFFKWCREIAKNNTVFVSEYSAPADFVCVWEGGVKTSFASTREKATHVAIERLYFVDPDNI